ncbi:MAG TPA: hypothetical protein VHZ55_00305 [Bryobacteraceae bacterium]|jgi:hypothetical protein|nr:hypothetical protein [Bryobacteraceae bacterium]
MSEQGPTEQQPTGAPDVRDIVRHAIEEFVRTEQRQAEPAYKAELLDERKRRESLETRLNQLVEENRKARAAAEEADRHSQIRNELQRTGISKVDLAFRAVKDEIVRAEDGRLQARGSEGKSLQDYVAHFVQENPELLPARIAGGSGAQNPSRQAAQSDAAISLESIRPGMNKDEMERVRQHIAKLASQALRGA